MADKVNLTIDQGATSFTIDVYANGKIVSKRAHDEDFDYSVWKPK